MSYDLGEVVPLSVTIRDATGALANAGSVTVTITLPDGTAAGPTTVSAASTGVYNYDYPTTLSGRHVVRWLATGSNAGAWTDVFEVLATDPGQLVSLAETKAELRIAADDTSQDGEVQDMLRAATDVVEHYVGAIVRRTFTDTYGGLVGSSLLLTRTPVLSIVSVVESGTTLTPADYLVDAESGVLRRVAADFPQLWLFGIQNVTVTYVAGRTAVKPAWREACLIITAHMWETQRGPQRGPFQSGSEDYDPRYSYSIPRRALELLNEPVGGIA
ncbi:hypothetical protein [Actinomadura rupiterrae]|uniref:hypothetical protein n=1 Tax=Actinomadura rupiterrae TaxID=559627 RepID=UPI0020A3AEF6|nr:hypothetical protein [Actinomadura rupiterrae]MCP2339167.1 putative phiE125 gp8 family phage protein [Actinomadura rupiterrae]